MFKYEHVKQKQAIKTRKNTKQPEFTSLFQASLHVHFPLPLWEESLPSSNIGSR